MKNSIKTVIIPCLLLCVVLSCDQEEMDYSYQETDYFQAIVGCMNMDRPVDSYNYPAYPTMDIWSTFQTKEEMKKEEKLSCLLSRSTRCA